MTQKIKIKNLEISYSGKKIVSGINADFTKNNISCLSGASGRGKTSILMCMNRLIDEIKEASVSGSIEVELDEKKISVYEKGIKLPWLRKKISMVFQDSAPLPMSIYKNMAFPIKVSGDYDKNYSRLRIEEALRQTGLWNEVKDRISDDARKLSGGQLQRLSIARSIVIKPEVLLLDEPSASLDSHNVALIAELMKNMKKTCTIIAVSHNQEMIEKVADAIFEVLPIVETSETFYSSLFRTK